jgi:TetR/AcrR family transcriptional regulator
VTTASGSSSPRNPEATRRRILAAALAEFASKGISGARVDRIAVRAKTNKRMLYHYFGYKDGLYRAVLNQRLSDRKPVAIEPGDEATRLSGIFERLMSSGDFLRLQMWEALERGARGRIENEDVRRATMAARVDAVRESQADGRTADDLDPELLVIAELGLAAYPLAFPQVTRLVTGVGPDDPEFRARYAKFLEALGAKLRAPRAEGAGD